MSYESEELIKSYD